MTYRLKSISLSSTILLVGCGGTGSFVAEGLCRLLIGNNDYHLFLVDHDRVEERNLGRQNFCAGDLGCFKAEALAKRLAARYGCEVNFIISPIEQLLLEDRGQLTIGCVDNPAARDRLQYAGSYAMGPRFSYCKMGGWYIDAGNGEHSGQVLIGNALVKECLRSFYPNLGICERLPLPTVQQPALLAPAPGPARDCAQSVLADEQSPLINQAMAFLVLEFVRKLLRGELGWMGAYLDMEAGTLSTVDATPEAVARITGYTVRQLEYRKVAI